MLWAMKTIALFAIRFYQRHISPYKGFCCAYAAYSGHASCSALGYRAIRRRGLWDGLALLDQRMEKCGVAARRSRAAPHRALGRQGGFADCDCDVSPCEFSSGDGCGKTAECASCDCEWPRRRKKRGDDQYVVIPSRGNVPRSRL